MTRSLLIIFTILIGLSAKTQVNIDAIRAKADSMLLDHIGDCLYNDYVQFYTWELDTIKHDYKVVDGNDLLLKDSIEIYYRAKYHLMLYEVPQSELWISFDQKQKVYQHNLQRVGDEYKSDCSFISELRYQSILKKSCRKKVEHRGYFISEYGLVGHYTYWPRGKRFYLGFTWVSLSTGKKVKDYQEKPYF